MTLFENYLIVYENIKGIRKLYCRWNNKRNSGFFKVQLNITNTEDSLEGTRLPGCLMISFWAGVKHIIILI